MHRSTMCGRLDLLPDQLGVVDLRGCVSRICRDGPGMTTRTALLLCVMLLVLRVPVKVFAGPHTSRMTRNRWSINTGRFTWRQYH
jgi:hypothetical protein